MPRSAVRHSRGSQTRGRRMSAGERTQARGGVCDGVTKRSSEIDKRRRDMCPVCLANLAFMAAGASSTSGLTALAVKKFFSKPDRNHQTNETRQDENRNNRTQNRQERNESQSRFRS